MSRHPAYEAQIRAYDMRWTETLPHAIDGTAAILYDLHERNVPLFAITNWNGDKFRETRPRFPFLGLFRDIVVSGDEGLLKPDAPIYQLLLDRNGLSAGDCLFIDDNAANVARAEALGMKAHHFTSPGSLRLALVDHGVLENR